jgi:SAM-dependent methyltransferase
MGFFACSLGTRPDARPVIDWEEPRCLLCNSNRGSILIEAPDPLPGSSGLWFAVTQCQDCGLCFTSPRPGIEGMGQFYPRHYPPHSKTLKVHAPWWWQWPLPSRGRHQNLEQMPLMGKGRLLDFGCGSGAFLLRMQKRGWKVTGIDASHQAIERIRTHLGLTALAGSLPHEELGDESFDVITMRHSLEHVHQPLEVLRAAHRLLVPGGQLVVAAPNIDSLQFKWFGRNWRGLDLPRHLTHFTPDTLQLMLDRAGFEVALVRMVRHPEWLRHSASLASKRPETPRWQRWLRGRLLASMVSWYSYAAGRCDAMVVHGVKCVPQEPRKIPEFSHLGQGRRPFPADRWRNT